MIPLDRGFLRQGGLIAGDPRYEGLVPFFRDPGYAEFNHFGNFRIWGFWVVLRRHRDRTRLIQFRDGGSDRVCGWINNSDLLRHFDMIRSRP